MAERRIVHGLKRRTLPRTFVGFSSTDLWRYTMMLGWKANEHIPFDFCDCQLQDELDSENESYIKRRCRERIQMAGTYAMLIGSDTRWKHKYVRWEAEVAIEQGCRLIGINLDRCRRLNRETCPAIFRDVGALFVPFSPNILAHALQIFARPEPSRGDWYFVDRVYLELGYRLEGKTAVWPQRLPPFLK